MSQFDMEALLGGWARIWFPLRCCYLEGLVVEVDSQNKKVRVVIDGLKQTGGERSDTSSIPSCYIVEKESWEEFGDPSCEKSTTEEGICLISPDRSKIILVNYPPKIISLADWAYSWLVEANRSEVL